MDDAITESEFRTIQDVLVQTGYAMTRVILPDPFFGRGAPGLPCPSRWKGDGYGLDGRGHTDHSDSDGHVHRFWRCSIGVLSRLVHGDGHLPGALSRLDPETHRCLTCSVHSSAVKEQWGNPTDKTCKRKVHFRV